MPDLEPVILPARQVKLDDSTPGDGMSLRRALPQSRRPRVGAWCFLDHFGPHDLPTGDPGMQVGPHPHIGLQTVTWLLEGELLHRDSLGIEQRIRPGQLNLMSAGNGITHSEESPQDRGKRLHGLQFWIALPDTVRNGDASFEHHAELPQLAFDGMDLTLFIGNALGEQSPATVHSPLVGLDISLVDGGSRHLPLDGNFEHALLVTEGEIVIDGHSLQPGALLFLPRGNGFVNLANASPARLALLGGEPFTEPLVMWWNFVARRHEEIVAAREDWMSGRRFARETGYAGEAISAPEISARLKAR